ncbi:UDP-N-acetylmuramoyl-tripeptide--D-alanyl-D-alanine ligase [Vibrio sp. SS-MA-C1-2]|uniref:UDP-N-acetylmuramoyl-tripeptide--D-alanyl-D- alanine ligase n=1 Tax=Vibrio sp. SS-MA-C1-2 TaxID=2908646 RepID=UPI001F15B0B6|nr:UDP-N-acetylmuramoyl-tripeptide--D-alanyl-D-alanine ligase [Vibrio sp. SS-MA-C1-2]UJF19606.1 UDP-N-acetylmuramoyl-tripeptide--D-alanyl-D-alanine ligase [Vibrio sp. SS-MA-C1-2]
MIEISLNKVAEIVGGELTVIDSNEMISEISTDSRTLNGGSLFVALQGENFDGHRFASVAEENGASALLVNRQLELSIPQVIVEDTLLALGRLGQWVKDQTAPITLALTGSCGKTTVKEMVAAILSRKAQTLATLGNFNNDIGVPLTLLRLTPQDHFAVIELGANHIGEIDYTANLTAPSVALINNLAAAHLEGFGSLEGVAKAKGEIFKGLNNGDTAIYNLESHNVDFWQQDLAGKKVMTFSLENNQADLFGSDIQLNSQGCARFVLNSKQGSQVIQLVVPGKHNVANAVAAAAMSLAVGASLKDIAQGLEEMAMVKGRVEVMQLTDTLRVIDDTYNASVAAVKAAADLLSSYKGKKVFIVGDMAELGDESLAMHQEVADYIKTMNIDNVLTFGEYSEVISRDNGGLHFTDKSKLIAAVSDLIENNNKDNRSEITVLVKGARSMKMEEIITAIKGHIQ